MATTATRASIAPHRAAPGPLPEKERVAATTPTAARQPAAPQGDGTSLPPRWDSAWISIIATSPRSSVTLAVGGPAEEDMFAFATIRAAAEATIISPRAAGAPNLSEEHAPISSDERSDGGLETKARRWSYYHLAAAASQPEECAPTGGNERSREKPGDVGLIQPAVGRVQHRVASATTAAAAAVAAAVAGTSISAAGAGLSREPRPTITITTTNHKPGATSLQRGKRSAMTMAADMTYAAPPRAVVATASVSLVPENDDETGGEGGEGGEGGGGSIRRYHHRGHPSHRSFA
eukprot:g7361.t1